MSSRKSASRSGRRRSSANGAWYASLFYNAVHDIGTNTCLFNCPARHEETLPREQR